jgi:hypothetical protein
MRYSPAALVIVFIVGCGNARTEPAPSPAPEPAAVNHFDATTAGVIRGQVTWTGDIPSVASFFVHTNADSAPPIREQRYRPNPNAPVIDPTRRGVGNAVVFLRGVDPRRARPWSQPPARVEIRDRQIHVVQGLVDSRFGFVRLGDAIELVSTEADAHSLHADGAAFFTLPFPDPDKPLARRLPGKGVVELSSNSGFFWMRSYLYVDDHPYYARTDALGRFEIPAVPPGEYEVVCWMPNWHEADHDRDPETSFIFRLRFAKPAERAIKVTLEAGGTREVHLEMSAADFAKR